MLPARIEALKRVGLIPAFIVKRATLVWRLAGRQSLHTFHRDPWSEAVMAIEASIPLLEEILGGWKQQIGEDYAAYRNHVCRMVHYCFALHDCNEEERRKIVIAGCFHDIGIWSDGTIDYLPPSVVRAREYLQGNGLSAWDEEIALMIDQHHKLRSWRDARYPLVEVFRKADLVDVSLGLVRFGLPANLVGEVKAQFPNQGFHKRLMQLAGSWFAGHPLSPPPFLKW
ncbi:MAG: hypothetical protein ACHQIO_12710 [Nevskiales bacterium]